MIERLRVMVRPFVEGDLVKVIERQSPGVNKAGGVARVSRLNEDGTLAVSYVLGNGKESSVEVKVSSPSVLLLLLLRLPLLLPLLLRLPLLLLVLLVLALRQSLSRSRYHLASLDASPSKS